MGPSRWDNRNNNSNHHRDRDRDRPGRERGYSNGGSGGGGRPSNGSRDYYGNGGGGGYQEEARRSENGKNQRGYGSVRDTGKRNRDYDRNDKDRDRKYRRDEPRNDDYYGRGSGGGGGGDRNVGDRRSNRDRDDDYYGRGGGSGSGGNGRRGGEDDRYGRRRDSGDGRYGDRGSKRRYSNEGYDDTDSDWKCRECSVWNYPDERQCARCGTPRDSNRNSNDSRYHDDNDHSQNGSASDGDSSVDEFGRKTKKQKKNKAKEQEWPPNFQDHSEDFVLDSRSGMFYEKESDFFYDPTSKLYYSNKKRAYFRYDTDKEKFLPVNDDDDDGGAARLPPAGSNGATDTAADQDHLMLVPTGANDKADPAKKMIAIKIKTVLTSPKKKKKRVDGKASTDAAVSKKTDPNAIDATTKVQKEHAASLERWSGRQDEMGKVRIAETGTGTGAAKGGNRPRFTKDGKPICWLCKRKFADLAKLQKHEELSKLHKENLAKQKQCQEVPRAAVAVEDGARYIDRAQQRRDLYGPELTLPEAPMAAGAPTVVEESAADPSSNVGQQMLQKLGWKEGTMLGRGSDHQKEQQAALAQDWNRIESLAAKNQQPARRGPQR